MGGVMDTFSPLSEARAWALREVWRDENESEWGMLSYIAGKLKKKGGGNPSVEAVHKFFAKLDADPQWFPGRGYQEQFGPPSVITPGNQAIVARSALAMSAREQKLSYAALVPNNAEQLLNPQTGQLVHKKRVDAILEERCFDDSSNPEYTWANRARFSKVALPSEAKRRRLGVGRGVTGRGPPPVLLLQ